MSAAIESVHVVVAMMRRGGEVLLVNQLDPVSSNTYWALPGGVVEPGELLADALPREVAEETGLIVDAIGPLLFVSQVCSDTRIVTAFTFAVEIWDGVIACNDPDELVVEARFLPVEEAINELQRLPWLEMHEPAVTWLRGAAPVGALWSYRR